MGHSLEAFLLRPHPAIAELTPLPGVRLVQLRQDLAMIPLTDALHDHFVDDPEHGHLFPEFWRLSAPLSELMVTLSQRGPIAYFETDYCGGTGTQAAILWDEGRAVWGPAKTPLGPPPRSENGPVNQALRRLGVTADRLDEFDAVGLGELRSNDDEDWDEYFAQRE